MPGSLFLSYSVARFESSHFSTDKYPSVPLAVSVGHQLPPPRATVEFCSYDNDQTLFRVSHPGWPPNDSSEAVQKQFPFGIPKTRRFDSVSITVFAGILTAICGIFLSLAERSSTQNSQPENRSTDNTSPASFAVPRSVIYQAVTFIGLAILGISQSTVPDSLTRSIFADGMRGTVFYLGASLALAGAVGVVFSSTARSVVLSTAILGTGGATVLGVSGNAIVGGVLLTGAALCGWWLHKTSEHRGTPTEDLKKEHSRPSSAIEQALSQDSKPIAEPLLTSVAIVLLCWVLTSTIQSAVQEGAGITTAMSGSLRALPRPVFATTKSSSHQLENESESAAATNSEPSLRETTLFWCAAGLLAATVMLGYSRPDSARATS